MLRNAYSTRRARVFGRNRSQRTGIPFRLIIAIGTGLFSLFSYYSTSETNPVTGEAQRVALSPDQEIAMGLRTAPEMAAQHGGLYRDQPAQEHIDRIGNQLVAAVNQLVARDGRENPFQ